jgi:ubiquinone/menaquinone biosynthesis C-methylase UbiE
MCGTAEVSLALARLGHRVVGLDRSAAMLAVGQGRLETAADRAARNLALVQGDACDLPVASGRFEFILVGGNGSFNHLDRGQAGAALTEIARVLSPGGGLGLELINPFLLPEFDAERIVRPLRRAPPGIWAEMRVANRYTAPAGQFHVRQVIHYELGRDRGQWPASFVLQAWTPDQIRTLLQAAGLGDVRFYGDYRLAHFDRWSSDLLVVARRLEPDPAACTGKEEYARNR